MKSVKDRGQIFRDKRLTAVQADRDYWMQEAEKYKAACLEWTAKTDWIQVTCQGVELGMHRADAIKQRYERLLQEVAKLRLQTGGGVQPGFRLLRDTTQEERSFPEDYRHENGSYYCTCVVCLRQFVGLKRRGVCKACEPLGGLG